MAANLAEEIKEVEARSKDIVKDAKNGAAQMIQAFQREYSLCGKRSGRKSKTVC
jgi:vacuolar-type H+-ATPase subunit H